MGRPSKLQLARRSASCRRADVRVWSKAASQSISLTLEILLEDVSQEDVAAHRRMVPVADKPMREARDPCTRRATRRASIRSRGPEASGRATQPHDARLGFRHHAAHPLGGGHHRNTRHRLHHGGAPRGDALASSPSLHGPRRRRVRGRAHWMVGRGGERPTPPGQHRPATSPT